MKEFGPSVMERGVTMAALRMRYLEPRYGHRSTLRPEVGAGISRRGTAIYQERA